jgi:hypothetical protein
VSCGSANRLYKQQRNSKGVLDMPSKKDTIDPNTWDPNFDAVVAAPKHHKVIFENDSLRVLEVTLEPQDEEPLHHHRWPSVFVLDAIHGDVHDIAPDGTQLPPSRDVMQAIEAWDGESSLVVHMAPQPLGRVLNTGNKTLHGIRIEIKR